MLARVFKRVLIGISDIFQVFGNLNYSKIRIVLISIYLMSEMQNESVV